MSQIKHLHLPERFVQSVDYYLKTHDTLETNRSAFIKFLATYEPLVAPSPTPQSIYQSAELYRLFISQKRWRAIGLRVKHAIPRHVDTYDRICTTLVLLGLGDYFIEQLT